MSDVQIANTIIQQLGGGRFAAMTGAKHMLAIDRGVRFKIGRNHRSINLVEITLDPSDTYTVKFCRTRKLEVKVVSEFSDIYFDGLEDIFTRETGMHTRLF